MRSTGGGGRERRQEGGCEGERREEERRVYILHFCGSALGLGLDLCIFADEHERQAIERNGDPSTPTRIWQRATVLFSDGGNRFLGVCNGEMARDVSGS
jgi:hypothetical protein